MRLLSLAEVLTLYERIMATSGGAFGIRDRHMLESALAQPAMSVGGTDAYPTLVEKVAALGFSLIKDHPFVDGNKRIGHGVMEMTLLLNGLELIATVDESEDLILGLASGSLDRGDLVDWLRSRIAPI